jgi:hypothetical protein
MVNPTIGQYLSLEARVVALEQFIVRNQEGFSTPLDLIKEHSLQDEIKDVVINGLCLNVSGNLTWDE